MKQRTIFNCQNCGYQTAKWLGKCPDCNSWNTLIEEIVEKENPSHKKIKVDSPQQINSIELKEENRILTNIKEFDRVLGGGIVNGSLILIGGEPGIGKSTLILQILSSLSVQNKKVLYVSGEESVRQIKIRNTRLKTKNNETYVLSEVNLDAILKTCEEIQPDFLAIDSIQTMYLNDLGSAPGTISQVRESTMKLMRFAKKTNTTIFLIGHLTKDGAIAGPRIMEHMVDTVLYFEGDRNHIFRILRAAKNRFGSTNEIGVFEMKEEGLIEIANPSAILLAERAEDNPGSVVTCSIEGTRPILIELQGLLSASNYATARRTIIGIDPNKVALLLAVMEKKLSINLIGNDVFMNVAGGIKVFETAIDLAIVSVAFSSFLDKPIPKDTVVLGEIGLTGELRTISHIDLRLAEIEKMGFKKCILPFYNLKNIKKSNTLTLKGIKNITELSKSLF